LCNYENEKSEKKNMKEKNENEKRLNKENEIKKDNIIVNLNRKNKELKKEIENLKKFMKDHNMIETVRVPLSSIKEVSINSENEIQFTRHLSNKENSPQIKNNENYNQYSTEISNSMKGTNYISIPPPILTTSLINTSSNPTYSPFKYSTNTPTKSRYNSNNLIHTFDFSQDQNSSSFFFSPYSSQSNQSFSSKNNYSSPISSPHAENTYYNNNLKSCGGSVNVNRK
jgi:hypothetical protein